MHDDMEPPLLVRAWIMAHLWGAKYQAMVCRGGSSGEAAFRESLRAQYTSTRHDAKGLRTYHITGTCGGGCVSRIASARTGGEVRGAKGRPLDVGRYTSQSPPTRDRGRRAISVTTSTLPPSSWRWSGSSRSQRGFSLDVSNSK